jgi:branched-chain amino acid aminotransferase
MLEPIRDFFVKDGVVMEVWNFDTSWTKGRKMIYEVMRVIGGKPLFAEKHIERLLQSAHLSRIKTDISVRDLMDSIDKLIHANPAEDGNIMFCIVEMKENIHFLSWYVPHYYPTEEEYHEGVFIHSIKAMRRDPNAKKWNTALRKQASFLKEKHDAYEILLVDKQKNITEGSKSNIFFIRGNGVFTSPEGKVLPGITRQKIKELCDTLLISFVETDIPLAEMAFYESAFLSGTSPGILPVNAIDKVRFNCSNEVLRKLMDAYDNEIS